MQIQKRTQFSTIVLKFISILYKKIFQISIFFSVSCLKFPSPSEFHSIHPTPSQLSFLVSFADHSNRTTYAKVNLYVLPSLVLLLKMETFHEKERGTLDKELFFVFYYFGKQILWFGHLKLGFTLLYIEKEDVSYNFICTNSLLFDTHCQKGELRRKVTFGELCLLTN